MIRLESAEIANDVSPNVFRQFYSEKQELPPLIPLLLPFVSRCRSLHEVCKYISVHLLPLGGRRISRGRMRSNLPQSEGPSLADLAKSGIKVGTLQKLMPKESLKQLIPYDQLVMRGEDLSRLIFAQLPVEQQQGRVGDTSPSEDSQTGDGQESKDTAPVWSVVLCKPHGMEDKVM